MKKEIIKVVTIHDGRRVYMHFVNDGWKKIEARFVAKLVRMHDVEFVQEIAISVDMIDLTNALP